LGAYCNCGRHTPLSRQQLHEGAKSSFTARRRVHALPEALRPVIRFAAITGWRVPSEVLPLEWRRVDLRAGEVRLDPGTTKNQQGRTFPLTDAFRTLLTERKALADALKARGVICPRVFHRHGKRPKR
jgi:integrase